MYQVDSTAEQAITTSQKHRWNLLRTFGTDAKDEFLVRFSCSRNDNKRCDAGLRLDKFALPAFEQTDNSSVRFNTIYTNCIVTNTESLRRW